MNYHIVIPARGNSKRFKRKNLALLNNKPLIEHSIDFALKFFEKDKVWVNSEDEEILLLAKRKMVNTYKRSKNLSHDETKTISVLSDQLDFFNKRKISCDAIILLQPTNPLRNDDLMRNAIRLFEDSGRESLASFSKSRLKLGTIDEQQNYIPFNYNPGDRSQDLKNYFFENGQIYITRSESISNGHIITKDVYPLICEDFEATIDIDYKYDLEIANLFT